MGKGHTPAEAPGAGWQQVLLELPGGPTLELTDDPTRVDFEAVWDFLSTTAYWGRWRDASVVRRQLDGAWRVVSAHRDGRMVGFARALSDGVALAYLADVYVLPEVRGRGVGQALVELMIDGGPGRDFRWMLHTLDAHGLYAAFGFVGPPETYMERPGRR